MENSFEPIKDYNNFNNKSSVCYVPESGDKQYTYWDILQIAESNEKHAQNIFDILEWQHPETVYLEILEDHAEILNLSFGAKCVYHGKEKIFGTINSEISEKGVIGIDLHDGLGINFLASYKTVFLV